MAEKVCSYFNTVNQLISSVKTIMKAPSLTHTFKNATPDIPMPPRSISTFRGTWLQVE